MIEKETLTPKLEKEPEKEKYGENVRVIITLMRHGPKAEIGDASLGSEAKETIRAKLEDFTLAKDGIKVYTSEATPGRCQETGRIIQEELEDFRRTRREIPELTSPFFFDKEAKKSLKLIIDQWLPPDYQSLSQAEKQKVEQEIEDRLVLHFLDGTFPQLVGDLETKTKESFPSKIEISPVDVAAALAERVGFYIKMSRKFFSESEVNLINISHTFNLMAFLKEAAIFDDGTRARDLNAREFLDKLGGNIREAEFYNIDVRRRNKTHFDATLKFRGKDFRLDFERIKELTETIDKAD